MNLFKNKILREIADKVLAGERIGGEEGILLAESAEILALGALADEIRKRKSGDLAFYSKNLNLNYTNVCVCRCRFCAYSRDPDSPDAFTMSLDEIEEKVASYDASEVHIVGGLHPDLPLEYYVSMLRRIKMRKPEILIQAFTAAEIDHFAKISGLDTRTVLERLKDAGLDTIPGGGAEIFSHKVREQICSRKISGERWLEVMETAHRLGIRTNATMLYGHVETSADRITHILALRDLQDRTGGFEAFVPLAFHPENTDLEGIDFTTGFEDLKVLSLGRILLDNFPHIKALWMYLGIKMAQVALFFGVDDLGGTCQEEKIVHAAGAKTAQMLTPGDMERIIREAGRIPVCCGSDYRIPASFGVSDEKSKGRVH